MSRLLCQTELPRRGGPGTAAAGAVRNPQSPLTESNRRPSPYHGDALPTELRGRRTDWYTQYAPARQLTRASTPSRTLPPACGPRRAGARETLATWTTAARLGPITSPPMGAADGCHLRVDAPK